MKRKHFLSLALMLALVLMLTMLPIRAEAATVASGTCGDGMTWVLDQTGTMTISGGRYMYYYTETDPAPWEEYRDNIYFLVILEKAGL